MPLALSQVRVDSLLGVSCPECEVRVDQGESPGCGLTCYRFQPPPSTAHFASSTLRYYSIVYSCVVGCEACYNAWYSCTRRCSHLVSTSAEVLEWGRESRSCTLCLHRTCLAGFWRCSLLMLPLCYLGEHSSNLQPSGWRNVSWCRC